MKAFVLLSLMAFFIGCGLEDGQGPTYERQFHASKSGYMFKNTTPFWLSIYPKKSEKEEDRVLAPDSCILIKTESREFDIFKMELNWPETSITDFITSYTLTENAQYYEISFSKDSYSIEAISDSPCTLVMPDNSGLDDEV